MIGMVNSKHILNPMELKKIPRNILIHEDNSHILGLDTGKISI